ncbi:hypothetical protein [Kocuria sp.]|uniref:hypothetical protein n=1 Tax=Kocuria sp. TaxID=1871328 RepID=UPI0026DEDEAC|nr:hypothetical protein [Kocuria sp.]MDO5619452.1 hypothetical protein [Kocuria sp.]
MRYLGVGPRHIGVPVLLLTHGRVVDISNADTGEVIARHTIDPIRNYLGPLR